jgi:asparagine synthase (glutamine-hydrolysing)
MRGTSSGGFAGVCRSGGFGRSPLAVVQPAESLQRMLRTMTDEATEERAVWLSPDGAALGALQTSDRSTLEPTGNKDGSLYLVATGEIMNAGSLRAELAKRHQFQTDSDLEVILHLVEEMGPDGLDLLEGSFACALWGPGKALILARDPMGLVPLYYGKDGAGNLLFATAVEALAPEVEWVEAVQPGARWAGAVPHRRGESRYSHVS